jgi:predicted DNA-binding protein with PD1-like motif
MEIFSHESSIKFHAIRLDKGDDLLESFEAFIKEHRIVDGVVVSGIGTLDQCHMHFVTTINDATQMEFKKWKDSPLEVASIDGIVANGEPHLHMVISNTERAWAGHVESGCRTLYLFGKEGNCDSGGRARCKQLQQIGPFGRKHRR